MHCSQCGVLLESNAKFCTSCGGKVEPPEAAATTEGPLNTTQQSNDGASQTTAIPNTSNPIIETMNQYFNFAVENLKFPTSRSENVTQNEKINGLITIGIYSLLLSLIIYKTYRAFAVFAGLITMDLFGSLYRNSFLDFFLKPFVFSLITMVILIATIYWTCKWMKASVHYWDIVGRLGAFLIVPTSLLLVALLFSFISGSLGYLILMLSFLGTGTAISYTMYSFNPNKQVGLDPFYAVIITYAITILAVYVLTGLF